MGGDLVDELFELGTWMPKAEPVMAYTLKADLATACGIVPAGDKLAKVNGVWTIVAAAEWDVNYTQI